MSTWSDEWLVEAVRNDPLHEAALDVLARRHSRALYGRCRMLTLNDDDAADLAQSAWVRVLRARGSLDPEGNFAGYLSTVATNLWRDGHRSARRAGAMSDRVMASLDAPSMAGDAETPAFGDLLARNEFDVTLDETRAQLAGATRPKCRSTSVWCRRTSRMEERRRAPTSAADSSERTSPTIA